MFRVWISKDNKNTWEKGTTFESIWASWQFEELLDGKVCEYSPGVFITMKNPTA